MQNNTENTILPLAAPFRLHDKLEGRYSEYNIEFRTEDSRLDDLVDFISLDFVKRVNIHFDGKIPKKIIETANKVKDCIYVRLSADQAYMFEQLRDDNIRFFFSADNAAVNFCQLNSFAEMGVTDVYIADDLTYNLPKVSKFCKKNNIKIRCTLNKIPLTTWNAGTSVRDTVYRPQDMELLQQYYDTFEFWCGGSNDKDFKWHEFEVLYRAFFVNHYWHGDLAELNYDIFLTNGFFNDTIMDQLTKQRIDCRRICYSGQCNYCDQIYKLSELLKGKGAKFA